MKQFQRQPKPLQSAEEQPAFAHFPASYRKVVNIRRNRRPACLNAFFQVRQMSAIFRRIRHNAHGTVRRRRQRADTEHATHPREGRIARRSSPMRLGGVRLRRAAEQENRGANKFRQ